MYHIIAYRYKIFDGNYDGIEYATFQINSISEKTSSFSSYFIFFPDLKNIIIC